MRDPRVEHDETKANGAEEHDQATNESADQTVDESENTETGSMEEELEAERQRAAEYLDQAQRARAELVNYRRRTEDELARMQKQAGERIISKFLPAIDDLDRAIGMMSEEDRSTSWGEGMLLVQRKIWSTLESEGVAPIESLGQPFDPALHEAISMQEGANGATTVVQEYQRGFTLGDRVLRPAMVVVGSPEDVNSGEGPAESDDQNSESRENDE
ncbi:MAG: nucleotide exchange factor GrpE [Thermomicrobiaceae bacterium]